MRCVMAQSRRNAGAMLAQSVDSAALDVCSRCGNNGKPGGHMNEDNRLTASWPFDEDETVDPCCSCRSAAEHAERCERDAAIAQGDE